MTEDVGCHEYRHQLLFFFTATLTPRLRFLVINPGVILFARISMEFLDKLGEADEKMQCSHLRRHGVVRLMLMRCCWVKE